MKSFESSGNDQFRREFLNLRIKALIATQIKAETDCDIFFEIFYIDWSASERIASAVGSKRVLFRKMFTWAAISIN